MQRNGVVVIRAMQTMWKVRMVGKEAFTLEQDRRLAGFEWLIPWREKHR